MHHHSICLQPLKSLLEVPDTSCLQLCDAGQGRTRMLVSELAQERFQLP